ncbi:MAG TPA: toll/interleukin-1 receptor domain-containing protein [Pyrinomonadaceae bacterium]|jgi:uncharacterized protein YjbI with pentapeptide repeats
MANQEYLNILIRGVKVWNQRRKENPAIRPDLKGANLSRAELRGANLSEVDLRGADLSLADLSGANLYGAYLRGINLHRANLSKAYLSEADLTRADLSAANLGRADLNRAILVQAVLSGAVLSGAHFSRAIIGLTTFADVDLSTVTGLDNVIHGGPSRIGIDTLYNSRGNIPEVFLRKAGVPENLITYMRSLTATALELYKCFISFTEADDLFSERLYNDLQGAGVRCWRWKEDAKWGKTLMSSIDEAVRVYDKLVIICSKRSLKSPAVLREIERALQKEDDLEKQGKGGEVLFPIRLDDYIFTGWNHYRKVDVIAKNVGDFRQWNKPEKYKKSFDRLFRDLQVEQKNA